MAKSNLRQLVIDELKALLPKSWALSDTALIDEPQKTSVEVILQSIERFPPAPQNTRLITYTVNVITPTPTDDAVDNALLTLMDAIDQSPTLNAPRAERAVWTSGQVNLPCYTITVQLAHEKD